MPNDDTNFWDCIERLEPDEDGPIAALIEASFSSEPDAVGRALRTGEARTAGKRPPSTTPAPMYLSRIAVKGFRGIGPQAHLDLPPGPGLILVTGRNGCGKSSFAEALELALTGSNSRWSDTPRREEMRAGWRNLHDGAGACIEVALTGELGPTRLTLRWKDDATDPEQAQVTGQIGRTPIQDREALGWGPALKTFGPILTYAGLGDLTNQSNSQLYDQLRTMLGLGSVREAVERLAATRKELEQAQREADQQRKGFMADLEALDDERATGVIEALKKRPKDLDTIERICEPSVDGSEVAAELHQVTAISVPPASSLIELAQALRQHHGTLQALQVTQAGRSHELAAVLRHALAWRQTEHDPCPVCGTAPHGEGWQQAAQQHLIDAEHDAASVWAAQQGLDRTMRSARQALRAPPDVLKRLAARGTGVAALQTWTTVAAGAELDDPTALADHLDEQAAALPTALEQLRTELQALRDEREERWRPLVQQLRRWLQPARVAVDASHQVKLLKKAEDRLKALGSALMAERFQPIEARTKAIWDQLRQRSHVELCTIELDGSHRSPRRKVKLQVSVDGQQDVALGVMSQGELHSLALSMFLPRMTHADSPFHFVVLDDPVQAMDPYKVDGLARVLEEHAKTRQVVVFTHDERLPEAVRRLRIEATVLSVERGARSAVQVAVSRDPVSAYLHEARALLYSADQLGPRAMARVIPMYCRNAFEAHFRQAYRRRALAAGTSHAEVQATLDEARRTMDLAALGLFGDRNAAGDVLKHLKKIGGREGVEVFLACKEGAHEGWDHQHRARVQATDDLLRVLRRSP